MEEDDYLFFFSISFERFVVSAMISFFFFGLGGRVKAKFMMDIKWGFFFFSYRMNILVR